MIQNWRKLNRRHVGHGPNLLRFTLTRVPMAMGVQTAPFQFSFDQARNQDFVQEGPTWRGRLPKSENSPDLGRHFFGPGQFIFVLFLL